MLLIMRHAKSSWDDSSLSDHDRPLNQRGRRDAPRMARWLREVRLTPDRIYCSSAVRALQTAQAVRDVLNGPQPVIIPELYEASLEVWQDQLASNMGSGCSLWIGHNPAIEALVSMVAREQLRMSTAAIAQLARRQGGSAEFPAGWKLVEIFRPKELPPEE